MAALTTWRDYQTKGPVVILDVEAAGNATYYKGALVVANAGGYADLPADAADLLPLGVYAGRQGKAFEVAAGEHPKIEVETGLVWIAHSGAAQLDVGNLFYCGDDGDVMDSSGAKNWGLTCKGWKLGYLLLDFTAPVKTA